MDRQLAKKEFYVKKIKVIAMSKLCGEGNIKSRLRNKIAKFVLDNDNNQCHSVPHWHVPRPNTLDTIGEIIFGNEYS